MTEKTDNTSRPSGPPVPPRVTQPPKPPGFPALDNNATRLIQSQSTKRKTSAWVWVGLGLILMAVAIAVALWFVLRSTEKTYDYSDGVHVPTEHEISSSLMESEPVEVEISEAPVNTATVDSNLLTGHVYMDGELERMPFTLDIDISPSGDVTGVCWNVLHDMQFKVTGTRNSNDGFSLDMSRKGVTTTLRLTAQGGGRYSGTWGKSQAVAARMEKGPRPGGSLSSAGAYKVSVSGNGKRALAYITDDYMWYADQGSGPGHRLRVRDLGDCEYEVLSDNGARIATFFLMETAYGVSGTLKDRTGKTFEIIGE